MELSIRRLCTAVGAVLLSSFAVIPAALAAEYDKMVHGPVDLPNGQWLNFYQKDQQVWGEMLYGDAPGVRIDDYGRAEIVAVFYYDFDKGGTKEVIVMLKDADGQHLRGYGFEGEELTKLPRLQAVLDEVAPTISTFTVGGVRKVLSQLPPQQYRMTYEAEGVQDPDIKAILDGTSKLKPTLIGYRNSEGTATDVKTAVEYKLRYPLTRTDKDAEGRERKYSLVATFDRSAYVEEDSSFMLVAIGYEADDIDWLKNGSEKIPRTGPFYEYMSMGSTWAGVASEAHYVQGELDGHFAAYDARNGSVMYAGDYKLGKQVGKWIEADSRETYWEGEYLDGKKQGKWVLQSMMDDADNYGFIHYNKGVPDGPSEIYTPDYDSSTEGAKKLSEKGIYLNGVKDGEWLESDGSKGQYQKGVKQGAWVEKVTQGDYRFQTGEGSYLDGKRSGTWVYIRTPDENDAFTTKQSVTYLYKTEVNYENGLRQGEAKLFNKDNFMFALKHYDKGRLHGESLWYSAPNTVSNVANYRQGELDGPQMWLEPNGDLNELSQYKFNDAIKLKPSQDECMMRKEPYAGDCEGVLSSKNAETTSIKDGEQRVYRGGRLSELSYYTNGSVDKEYRFDSNGRLMSLQTYKAGQEYGPSIRYSTDGGYSLVQYGHLINNRLSGPHYTFYPNGQLKSLWNYCQQEGETWNGEPYFWDNAIARCGIQREYFDNGAVSCIEDLDSNYAVDKVCYDQNGKLASEMLRIDEQHVVHKRYINGVIYQEEPGFSDFSHVTKGRKIYHLENPKSHGVFKSYDSSGKLKYEKIFDMGKAGCMKKYDANGKQTPETASCQF
ncbi:toxin-antitoxin system YwqK family antitoxin [Shewanella seohaensis]|uniref:toxin-antitoxin system YwqK family antitoxin n=1 Tax=Shewanella seohaensis TaxID=755175 RepID=UPI0035BAFD6E